jgi:ribosomal protein S12 methylthiotransferase
MEEILEEASWLIVRGGREIQLIAQDLSYYGIDITGSNQLPELVTRLAELPGLAWLRLHYTYPHHFPMELLTVMREHPTVCRYLDMAFQHISDPVLTRMRRPVTRQQTYELIQHIREAVPGIHLRTTLMVGFPGETEVEFTQSVDFLREIGFAKAHVFAYSPRPGTKAAGLPNQVAKSEKERRSHRMGAAAEERRLEFLHSQIGLTEPVLFETEIQKGIFEGYTPNYTPVRAKSAESLCGKIRPAKITGVADDVCNGIVD